jgi:tRNA(Ile)-lysidine synthase
MINIIRQYIKEHQLIPAGVKTVYAAVSGGIDSCVMLDILSQLQQEFGYKIIILHYNHGTRGTDSREDELFVENLAKKYRLKIVIGRIHGRPLKLSETFLREQRMKFFEKSIAKMNDCRIATGHNLDDNIETFLMRIAKGSRVKGLLAIRPARGYFIRPLLNITRKNIFEYAKNNNLDYREDSSNRDITIIRNKIRHRVIPYLEKAFDTDLQQNIPRIIEDLYRYHAIYEDKLHEAIQNTTKKTKTGISLNRKRYSKYNETIRRGLVEYCISNVYPLNYRVSDRNLAIWDDFISQVQVGKKLFFLEDGIAIAERQYIMFGNTPRHKKETYHLKPGVPASVSDMYQIRFQKVKMDEIIFTNEKNVEYIDGDKSGKSLLVRFWKKGDSFRPLGMSNKRKLSDFFTDLKINAMLKKEIPLVCKGETIIWIAGYRLDDQFKISPDTKTVYKLELANLKNS